MNTSLILHNTTNKSKRRPHKYLLTIIVLILLLIPTIVKGEETQQTITAETLIPPSKKIAEFNNIEYERYFVYPDIKILISNDGNVYLIKKESILKIHLSKILNKKIEAEIIHLSLAVKDLYNLVFFDEHSIYKITENTAQIIYENEEEIIQDIVLYKNYIAIRSIGTTIIDYQGNTIKKLNFSYTPIPAWDNVYVYDHFKNILYKLDIYNQKLEKLNIPYNRKPLKIFEYKNSIALLYNDEIYIYNQKTGTEESIKITPIETEMLPYEGLKIKLFDNYLYYFDKNSKKLFIIDLKNVKITTIYLTNINQISNFNIEDFYPIDKEIFFATRYGRASIVYMYETTSKTAIPIIYQRSQIRYLTIEKQYPSRYKIYVLSQIMNRYSYLCYNFQNKIVKINYKIDKSKNNVRINIELDPSINTTIQVFLRNIATKTNILNITREYPENPITINIPLDNLPIGRYHIIILVEGSKDGYIGNILEITDKKHEIVVEKKNTFCELTIDKTELTAGESTTIKIRITTEDGADVTDTFTKNHLAFLNINEAKIPITEDTITYKFDRPGTWKIYLEALPSEKYQGCISQQVTVNVKETYFIWIIAAIAIVAITAVSGYLYYQKHYKNIWYVMERLHNKGLSEEEITSRVKDLISPQTVKKTIAYLKEYNKTYDIMKKMTVFTNTLSQLKISPHFDQQAKALQSNLVQIHKQIYYKGQIDQALQNIKTIQQQILALAQNILNTIQTHIANYQTQIREKQEYIKRAREKLKTEKTKQKAYQKLLTQYQTELNTLLNAVDKLKKMKEGFEKIIQILSQ